ncbi:superoxide dismutase, Cu-Zn family [Prauserella aidingensis]|nr:superoxide dismutase, Cu-Zn family [Prauserella aidingensis]
MRRLPVALSLMSAVALASTGTATAATTAADPAAVGPAESRGGVAFAHGTFAPYVDGATAATYDLEGVPAGARASVLSLSSGPVGTVTKFTVSGLQPNRQYGAHVHENPCGPTGDDAGPHFQHAQDPNPPSTDPEYANPDNEVWLDFTTTAHGSGFAASHVDWSYGDRRPASVVIHEHHTSTEPGEAGDAGSRLACINVHF